MKRHRIGDMYDHHLVQFFSLISRAYIWDTIAVPILPQSLLLSWDSGFHVFKDTIKTKLDSGFHDVFNNKLFGERFGQLFGQLFGERENSEIEGC